ncbi:MAG TPA: type IV pilus assembly protein PilM [Candidatus Paceibacterota bacterium]|nr:type IV pilus assembly protein PilM [Candidatus Paceibacterota bacterium]
MFKNLHNRFFPIPKFLSMPSFGFDVSDESLKFVRLGVGKNGIKIEQYGECKVPAGIIESGKIKQPKALIKILTDLKKEHNIKSVRVSLPEEQLYLFRLKLEKNGLQDIKEGIELSLEEHIPIPAQEAIFDYEILKEDNSGVFVQVAAMQRFLIEDYLSVFEQAGIMVASMEPEAQAASRAIIKRDDANTYMVVDFGEKRTGISIISKGVVMFTSTVDVGGVMLTNLIQKSFNISFEEAEKMKQQYGLQRNSINKEMFSVLLNGVSILRDEIDRHFLYWHTHQDEEGKDNPPIEKILLCGGDSNLIGLTEYLSVSMKHKVEVANSWTNILNVEKKIPKIDFKKSLSYTTALGLALGDFNYD